MPFAKANLPAQRVLIVSGSASAREALGDVVREAFKEVALEGLAAFSDAVLRLARGDVQLVLLDLPNLQPLSAAAPLMLRGLVPAARVLVLGVQQDMPGFERVADAGQLARWLATWR